MRNFVPSAVCASSGKTLSVEILEYIADPIRQLDFGIEPDGSSTDDARWYGHEIHMRAMSKVFSDVLFTLGGVGEETGDIWKKYFLNGKMQIAKADLSIAEFDESKGQSRPSLKETVSRNGSQTRNISMKDIEDGRL